MSTSNIFFKGCVSSELSLDEEQQQSWDRLNAELIAAGEQPVSLSLVDESCARETNTCGKTISQLFDEYELYDFQRGVLYKSWGDVEFPWQLTETTNNLNYDKTRDEWGVATYIGLTSYYTGDRVLYIEDDGFEIALYEANENIPAPAGPLDRTKWTKVCSIQSPEPVKLPSIEELIATYEFYHLKEYLEDWGEAESTWNQDLTPRDSDEWDDYKIRRDFFYKVGDFALVEAECSDAFCLWINIRDMPVTDENLTVFSKFSPYYDFKGEWTSTDANTIRVNQFKHPYKVNDVIKVIVINDVPAPETNDATSIKEYTINSIIDENNFTYTTTGAVPISSAPKTINIVQVQFWEKIYCVNSGQNKCLGPQSDRNLENYQFVQIGSKGHYVEQPIPNYKLKGNYLCDKDNFVDLNEAAELRPRAILTQDEINSLGAINYAVTVQGVNAGNRYFIDGVQQATLNLIEGETYRFNQNDSSNANHPLRFSTTSNGTHGGGVEFTEGVTKVGIPGNSDAYVQITIPIGTPTLYYYCANHSLMGGIANT